MVILVVGALCLVGLYPWVKGQFLGVFTGFIPCEIISFAIAYSIMEGRPTSHSSFYAFWLGMLASYLPFAIALVMEKQTVAREKARRESSGRWLESGEWIGPKNLSDR